MAAAPSFDEFVKKQPASGSGIPSFDEFTSSSRTPQGVAAHGTEKMPGGVAPGVPKAPLPTGLAPDKPEFQGDSYGSELPIPSRNFATEGLDQVGQGVTALASGNRPAKGISGIVRGAAKIASPLAPGLIAAAPAAAAGSALLGGAGSGIGRGLAHVIGASPEAQDAASDVGGVAGGIMGGKAGSAVGDAVTGIVPYLRNRGVQNAVTDLIPYFGGKINKLRGAFEAAAPTGVEPVAPEPFRPNPAVASRIRFGGPVDASGGQAFGPPVRAGGPITPIVSAPQPAVEPFRPFTTNPNISKGLRFTPSEEPGTGMAASAIPARQSGVPVSDLPPIKGPAAGGIAPLPVYQGPNKVNPNIARNIGFTPGGEDQFRGGTASPATLGTRAEMMRQQRLKADQIRSAAPVAADIDAGGSDLQDALQRSLDARGAITPPPATNGSVPKINLRMRRR